jgi:hypothetical protein
LAAFAGESRQSGLDGGASGIRTLGDLPDSIAGIWPVFGSLFGPEREDAESERISWLRIGFSNFSGSLFMRDVAVTHAYDIKHQRTLDGDLLSSSSQPVSGERPKKVTQIIRRGTRRFQPEDEETVLSFSCYSPEQRGASPANRHSHRVPEGRGERPRQRRARPRFPRFSGSRLRA